VTKAFANLTDVLTDLSLIIGCSEDHAVGWTQISRRQTRNALERAACVVATIVLGFAWGGWVTGGTATRMASDAADGAEARLVSASCVIRFNQGSDAVAQLSALKKANSYEWGDMIKKGGWVTMPGGTDPVVGAADICVRKLLSESL
jgi:hypothetical protein